MDVQVRQVAVLISDVGRCNFPRVLIPEHTSVGTCLIDGGTILLQLLLIGAEYAIADEVHLFIWMCLTAPSIRYRTNLVPTLLAMISHALFIGVVGYLSDREVRGRKPCVSTVTPAIVRIFGRIVVRILPVVEDTHTDGIRKDCPDLPFLQLEPEGTRIQDISLVINIRHYSFNAATTRSTPLVAYIHLRLVEDKRRHSQLTPKYQPLHLTATVTAELDTESGHTFSISLRTDDYIVFRGQAFEEGYQAGCIVGLVLAEESSQRT